ncbi:CPBP family intramembrane glutamic endopeptidase [Mucilaginibacter sp. cycad4]|uniref:CPBP family intramembrane glutamic endopeptidase n=1 Tax=Mucilaginibacter sp. cycad4 TaxID=3342096 RepID=UPI002AAC13D9|nr:CPBP family intramembrane glutamic endopeptidase [Mucilaginibacter gossypii]WPU99704.1 CPBP family intramembrane glutamic endopeptidase [Mucilaginibacter gossypii]
MSEVTNIELSAEEPENIDLFPKAAYPNITSVVKFFFVYLVFLIIVTIIASIIFMNTPKEFPAVRSIFKLLMNSAPVLMAIQYTLKRGEKQQGYPSTINYGKINGWLIPVLIIAAVAFSIVLERISVLLPMPPKVREIFERMFTKDLFSFTSVVIIAPIVEEILCRGIILKGLLKNYSPTKAIFISAVLFSVLHLNPWQAIPAFFGGLFLGWIYYKTQSVIPGMIFHAAINTTGFAFLFLGNAKQDLPDIFGGMYYPVLLISIIVFVAMCILIHKKARVTPATYPISNH